MIDVSSLGGPAGVAIILFGGSILLMLLGLPVAFSLGGVAAIVIFLLRGATGLGIIATRVWSLVDLFFLLCLPLFVFMGLMLERSGIAGQLYDMMHKWSGGLNGGLAAGTVGICMLMAAMTGMSAAALFTMGLTALPEMLKRGYNKSIAIGCIGAGSALGSLIPPSITMVFYALVSEQAIGKLFAGGVIPGVMLGLFFIVYILIRCRFQPNLGPALPLEARASWPEKLRALRQVILPLVIIVMVLGSIFMGIATPTEAAAVGALGTLISAAINRSLTFKAFQETCYGVVSISAMGLWIAIATFSITSITFSVGAGQFIEELFLKLPGGQWGVIVGIQIIWFILGCLIDPTSIIMITGPIFIPIIKHLGLDLVWFGIVYVVNMEMSYLTPPFGINLFYLRAILPKGIIMSDVYRSVTPFVLCQALATALVIIFPQLALWLPSKM